MLRMKTSTGHAGHINLSLAGRCGGAVVKHQKKLWAVNLESMKSEMKIKRTKK
jgi:hypothetical protein